MKQAGIFNTTHGVDKNGFGGAASAFYNLEAPMLYEESLRRGESVVMPGGAINAETGVHTGRSPKDKFTVRDATTEATIIPSPQNNSTSSTPISRSTLRARICSCRICSAAPTPPSASRRA